MNSVLQCLIHTNKGFQLVGLRDFFIDDEELQVTPLHHFQLNDDDMCLEYNLYKSMCEFLDSRTSRVLGSEKDWQLRRLVESVYLMGKRSFQQGKQGDAADFLHLILDNLQTYDISRVQDSFMAIITDERFECGSCFKKRDRLNNRDYNLRLPIAQKNVHDIQAAINNYLSVDPITDYNCDKCLVKSDLNRTRTFRQLPKVLVVHLLRFNVSYFSSIPFLEYTIDIYIFYFI